MGTQRAISVYADTSVFGGVFDDEFSGPSKTFVEAVVAGRFTLVTSGTTPNDSLRTVY